VAWVARGPPAAHGLLFGASTEWERKPPINRIEALLSILLPSAQTSPVFGFPLPAPNSTTVLNPLEFSVSCQSDELVYMAVLPQPPEERYILLIPQDL
jgi:hypothetical protein